MLNPLPIEFYLQKELTTVKNIFNRSQVPDLLTYLKDKDNIDILYEVKNDLSILINKNFLSNRCLNSLYKKITNKLRLDFINDNEFYLILIWIYTLCNQLEDLTTQYDLFESSSNVLRFSNLINIPDDFLNKF